MAQPPAYTRTKNFAGNPGNNTDNGAINTEFDKVATSVNALRFNSALLQNDDGTLKSSIITAAALSPEALGVIAGTATAQAEAAAATAIAAAAQALAAAGGLGVVDNITYTTLTEGGTYPMDADETGVHHIADGETDPNNPHSIARYVTDMTTDADAEALVVANTFEWQETAQLTQPGPRTDQVAQWYKDTYPTHNQFEWCRHGLAWFVAMEAQGNSAVNTRVQIRNLRTLYLSNATKTWQQFDLASRPAPEEWTYPFEPTYEGNGDARDELDANGGGISVKPDYPLFNHGYGNGHFLTNPADIRATMVCMEFRLIKDNPAGVDDRANAKYVVDCGMDWRPGNQDVNGVTTFHEWPSGWVPGVGNSKMLLATNDWRGSALLIPNDWHGCTFDELLSNPPPFTINASPGTAETTVVLPADPTDMMVRKFISVAPIQKFRVVAADGDNGDYTINLPQDTEIAFRYRQSDSTWRRIY